MESAAIRFIHEFTHCLPSVHVSELYNNASALKADVVGEVSYGAT